MPATQQSSADLEKKRFQDGMNDMIGRAAQGKTGMGLVFGDDKCCKYHWIQTPALTVDSEVQDSLHDILKLLKKRQYMGIIARMPDGTFVEAAASNCEGKSEFIFYLATNESYWDGSPGPENWLFRKWYHEGVTDGSTLSETRRSQFPDNVWLLEGTTTSKHCVSMLSAYLSSYMSGPDTLDSDPKKRFEPWKRALRRNDGLQKWDFELESGHIDYARASLIDWLTKSAPLSNCSDELKVVTARLVRAVMKARGADPNKLASAESAKTTGSSLSTHNLWGQAENEAASWLWEVEKKSATPLNQTAVVEYLSNKTLANTYILAIELFSESRNASEYSSRAKMLQVLKANEEPGTKAGAYRCARGSVVRRSRCAGFAFYFAAIALIGISIVMGFKSEGANWKGAAASFNLVLTGVVALMITALGFSYGGRYPVIDAAFFDVAVDRLSTSKDERHKVMAALRKVSQPGDFVKGQASWTLGENNGWTMIDNPVKLSEVGKGWIHVGHFGLAVWKSEKGHLNSQYDKESSDKGTWHIVQKRDAQNIWDISEETAAPNRYASFRSGILIGCAPCLRTGDVRYCKTDESHQLQVIPPYRSKSI